MLRKNIKCALKGKSHLLADLRLFCFINELCYEDDAATINPVYRANSHWRRPTGAQSAQAVGQLNDFRRRSVYA